MQGHTLVGSVRATFSRPFASFSSAYTCLTDLKWLTSKKCMQPCLAEPKAADRHLVLWAHESSHVRQILNVSFSLPCFFFSLLHILDDLNPVT